jgi:ammonium transporter, Amt family
MFLSASKKPTFLGAINGMIVGLVAITPGAGYVNGLGAMLSGMIASTIVWFAWTFLEPILARRVDDAMGVVYTHGLAGLCGGLLVGIFADPNVVVYPYTTSGTPFAATGWLYGNRHLFFLQLGAAATIIVWDALMTFVILRIIAFVTPLRMPDEQLEIGDLAVHGEEAYPSDEGVSVGVGASAAGCRTDCGRDLGDDAGRSSPSARCAGHGSGRRVHRYRGYRYYCRGLSVHRELRD